MREQAAAQAKYDQLHEDRPYHDGTEKHWSEKRDASHPYHYNEGTTIYVATSDLNPDDTFLGKPAAPEPEEA